MSTTYLPMQQTEIQRRISSMIESCHLRHTEALMRSANPGADLIGLSDDQFGGEALICALLADDDAGRAEALAQHLGI